ncbi:MCE family protein [Mycolicibacterium sphagni]|uniref:MCE-family protein n=1 Tax=Mycolicibacterium sphagni TaxID=1786 RepID=A0A255DRX3_9MYCO|nr:MCE family protein [Mycolicibacterium sphagni]OYN82148.1 MCE-family protein [Mycolicibacterium sphagni]
MTAPAPTKRAFARPLAGLLTVGAIIGVVIGAAGSFNGDFTKSVAVTVLSPRAGLVMDPGAKVKMVGVEVGRVSSIDYLPNGQAAIHLALNPDTIRAIPDNVVVEISATTVFGAKYVQLAAPNTASSQSIRPNQVLESQRVTVEINTVFQRLTEILAKIDPTKLNQTLGAIGAALRGRGEQLGPALSDLDEFLAEIEPSLPNVTRDLQLSQPVLETYADAAPDLLRSVVNSTRILQTVTEEQQQLDALLIATIGLADIGNAVVGGNRQALTDVLHLLVPTTELADRYHQALNCGIAGMLPYVHQPPLPLPGILVSAGFTLGAERYRYPADLPKVAATGGPHCMGLPDVAPGNRPPFLVTDVGASPARYGNQGILLNSDGLKQMLFGPIDGPPRNSFQTGQPG